MALATKLLKEIDAELERRQEDGRRKHLGASLIGRPCARQLWYVFRWAKLVQHEGHVLRIFQRGHDEEPRLIKLLQTAGITVFARDRNGKQYRVSEHHGHFGGSADAVATGIPDLAPNEPALLEFKTHNEKSFSELIAKGVKDAKWEHYVQAQIYMRKLQLTWGVYIATCKNDDQLHCELLYIDPQVADHYILRAGQIIASPIPLLRLSNNKSWWQCKFCDFHRICHYDEPVAVNCRTCTHSVPSEFGQWTCRKYNAMIPESLAKTGCTSYEVIPECSVTTK